MLGKKNIFKHFQTQLKAAAFIFTLALKVAFSKLSCAAQLI